MMKIRKKKMDFMKKKICIITSSFPSHKNDSSSAGVFVRDFALLLAQENFDVFVIAPQRNDSKYNDERISIHFFPWLGGEMGLSFYNPKNPIHFFKLASVILSGIWSSARCSRRRGCRPSEGHLRPGRGRSQLCSRAGAAGFGPAVLCNRCTACFCDPSSTPAAWLRRRVCTEGRRRC